jgi:NAD(P)-dependent dehydrogenase (short-subunit alcohol dehydrogenase family)
MQITSILMPFMRSTAYQSKQQGTISVLSASAGEYPWAGHTIFNMHMASLNMMVRCIALENAAFNIRVNAVAPGYVRNTNADNDHAENARTNEAFNEHLDAG